MRLFLHCPSATKCNRSNSSRRGYHAMLNDVFSPCLVMLRSKINFAGIPVISSLYIYSGQGGYVSACNAHEWCLQRTGAVPLRCRHAHRLTDMWLVARRTHVEGTTKAWRQYVERAFAVGFFCVRFGALEARRPQEMCVAGTVAAESLSHPNQPQETQNLRRNSVAAPDTQEP